MASLFREGDLALLDRSEFHRRAPDERSYYAVEIPDGGLLRRLRRAGDRLHLAPFFGPADSIPVTDRNMLEVVKAKVVWIGRSLEPSRIAEGPFQPAG